MRTRRLRIHVTFLVLLLLCRHAGGERDPTRRRPRAAQGLGDGSAAVLEGLADGHFARRGRSRGSGRGRGDVLEVPSDVDPSALLEQRSVVSGDVARTVRQAVDVHLAQMHEPEPLQKAPILMQQSEGPVKPATQEVQLASSPQNTTRTRPHRASGASAGAETLASSFLEVGSEQTSGAREASQAESLGSSSDRARQERLQVGQKLYQAKLDRAHQLMTMGNHTNKTAIVLVSSAEKDRSVRDAGAGDTASAAAAAAGDAGAVADAGDAATRSVVEGAAGSLEKEDDGVLGKFHLTLASDNAKDVLRTALDTPEFIRAKAQAVRALPFTNEDSKSMVTENFESFTLDMKYLIDYVIPYLSGKGDDKGVRTNVSGIEGEEGLKFLLMARLLQVERAQEVMNFIDDMGTAAQRAFAKPAGTAGPANASSLLADEGLPAEAYARLTSPGDFGAHVAGVIVDLANTAARSPSMYMRRMFTDEASIKATTTDDALLNGPVRDDGAARYLLEMLGSHPPGEAAGEKHMLRAVENSVAAALHVQRTYASDADLQEFVKAWKDQDASATREGVTLREAIQKYLSMTRGTEIEGKKDYTAIKAMGLDAMTPFLTAMLLVPELADVERLLRTWAARTKHVMEGEAAKRAEKQTPVDGSRSMLERDRLGLANAAAVEDIIFKSQMPWKAFDDQRHMSETVSLAALDRQHTYDVLSRKFMHVNGMLGLMHAAVRLKVAGGPANAEPAK